MDSGLIRACPGMTNQSRQVRLGRAKKAAMQKYHWEDFKPGGVAVYGPRLVTREEIIAFAAEFDPQPMHLDEAAASATMLAGLAASGWHTCSLLMRMICDGFILDSTSMGSPGIEEVRWLKPLRPGTTIRVRTTVLDTRASGSRPEMGLTKFMMEVLDDADAVIASLTTTLLFRRREPGAKP
jgi:acyl dehydratase